MKKSIFLVLACIGLYCAGKAQPLVVTWYAPGIGIVRKEMQQKNGKVVSRSELIFVSLPAPV